MKTLKYIFQTAMQVIAMAVIVLGSVWVGYRFGKAEVRSEKLEVVSAVPTIQQIQQLIGCEKIDGKIGPETLDKWNRAVCDQYAKPYFTAEHAENAEGTLCRGK